MNFLTADDGELNSSGTGFPAEGVTATQTVGQGEWPSKGNVICERFGGGYCTNQRGDRCGAKIWRWLGPAEGVWFCGPTNGSQSRLVSL